MNKEFEPKKIKLASKYIDDKLNSFEQRYKNSYVIEKRKVSLISRVFNSIFK